MVYFKSGYVQDLEDLNSDFSNIEKFLDFKTTKNLRSYITELEYDSKEPFKEYYFVDKFIKKLEFSKEEEVHLKNSNIPKKLINKKTIEINYILLFFSPVTMLFYVYNPAIIGRKEILLFLIFCLFVSLVSNKAISNTVYNILVVLIAVAAFFHELIIFYVPYF